MQKNFTRHLRIISITKHMIHILKRIIQKANRVFLRVLFTEEKESMYGTFQWEIQQTIKKVKEPSRKYCKA